MTRNATECGEWSLQPRQAHDLCCHLDQTCLPAYGVWRRGESKTVRDKQTFSSATASQGAMSRHIGGTSGFIARSGSQKYNLLRPCRRRVGVNPNNLSLQPSFTAHNQSSTRPPLSANFYRPATASMCIFLRLLGHLLTPSPNPTSTLYAPRFTLAHLLSFCIGTVQTFPFGKHKVGLVSEPPFIFWVYSSTQLVIYAQWTIG